MSGSFTYEGESDSLDDLYAGIVQDMRDAAKEAGAGEITDTEAHEAARNFIGFFQTLLEIEREKGLDAG